ncbi:hypothetical protein FO519_005110 [Halicephalobus sp. NKZ332]|nr:hypothetical protein FO519_005110 [Halicephalobus sp. NKZ332]
MPESGFYFEDFQAFISDSRTIVGILATIFVAILIPVLGSICFKIYLRMSNEKVFVSSEPRATEEESNLIDEEEKYENEPEEPAPPKHVEFENVNPERFSNITDITDEERILMDATMAADEQDFDMLKALNRVKLHGKLATAQLRAKTQKIESGMTDEEREHERKTRNEQLAKIFSMMEQQSEKFGIQSEDDLQEQMKLYSL